MFPTAEPKFNPVEAFNDLDFFETIGRLNEINDEQFQIFIKEPLPSRLPASVLIELQNEMSLHYQKYYFEGEGWHYYNLLDTVADLTTEVSALNTLLSDDYFNQDLIVGDAQLKWPESATYLQFVFQKLHKLHEDILEELISTTSFEKIYSPSFPGLSLITNSHSTWTDNFKALLNSKKIDKEKYELLNKAKASITELTTCENPTYVELSDFETEIKPGTIKILPCWYSIDDLGVEKKTSEHPDLMALVNWIDNEIKMLRPCFLLAAGKYKVVSTAKTMFTKRWERIFNEEQVELSSLTNFIESNFLINDNSKKTLLPYSFQISKSENLKELVTKIIEIFNEFVFVDSKADIILWLHIHFESYLSYDTLKDYVYRKS